jgi:predicted transcriptional regulator
LVAEVPADPALVLAFVAEVAAAVAEVPALVADVAALLALVAAAVALFPAVTLSVMSSSQMPSSALCAPAVTP